MDGKQKNKKYYRNNRSKILKNRRERYREDRVFRESVIERASLYAEKQATQRRRLRESSLERQIKEAKKRPLMPRVVRKNGTHVVVHSISELAVRSGISQSVIKLWESKRVLPRATFYDSLGRRWYSQRFIRVVSKVIRKYRPIEWELSLLKNEIRKSLKRKGERE